MEDTENFNQFINDLVGGDHDGYNDNGNDNDNDNDNEENFNQFINDLVGGNHDGYNDNDASKGENDLEGGLFSTLKKITKRKVIFFKTTDVIDYKIFTIKGQERGIPIGNIGQLKQFVDSKRIVQFTKDDLYKQIHRKAYTCFTGEKQIRLVVLTSQVISEKAKTLNATTLGTITSASKAISADIQKTKAQAIAQKDIALGDISFDNYRALGHLSKADLINRIVKDVLNKPNSEVYYKALLEKLDVNNLNELVKKIQSMKGQKGGDIYDMNYMDDMDDMNNMDDMDGGFLDFFIGGKEPPSTINFNIAFNKPEYQFRDFLVAIKNSSGLDLNACAVVDEGIVNKSVLEFLYIKQ
jgi:hypothetical protein